MNQAFLILFSTACVLALTFYINLLITRRMAKRSANLSQEDWDIGGRDLPWYVVIGTQFASCMGGGVLVGHVGNGFNNGLSVILYGLLSASTLLLVGLIAKWIRENRFVTISDILQSFTGKSKLVSIFAGILSLCVPFGWITSQLVAFGKLYSSMTGLSINLLIVILSIISIAFVLPAGLKTVAWTDTIFSCFMIVTAVAVVFYANHIAGGLSHIVANVPSEITQFPGAVFSVGWYTVFLWILSILPGGMTNQLYFQRYCAIRDPKKLPGTMGISFVLVFLTTVWSCFMGLAIRSMNPGLASEMATGWFMEQLPLWGLAIFAGLVVTTILSTVSSGVQTVTVNITRDVYKIVSPDTDEAKSLKVSRVLSVCIIAIAAIFSMYFPSVLSWLVNTYAYSAAGLFFPIYGGYLLRDKNFVTVPGVISGMIMGIVGCVAASMLNTAIPFVAYGLVFSGVTFFTVCALTRSTIQKAIT